MVLHGARIGMDLKGVVSFHGSLGSFHKPVKGEVKAKVLVCHGAADALVSDEEIAGIRQEMADAAADFRFGCLRGRPPRIHQPPTRPRTARSTVCRSRMTRRSTSGRGTT